MGLTNYKGRLINDDRYIYPFPEIIIQTTRNVTDIQHLGFGDASNENGYIYFYADADWKENPAVYIGESKNSLQSRHSATHKSAAWFKAIQYPFIGIVNSPDKPWDTDTRRAIESLTVHKAHAAGFQIVNSTNSTWTNGGTVHPNVNRKYVDDVSEIIVQYLVHHTGWDAKSKVPRNLVAENSSTTVIPNIATPALNAAVEAPKETYSYSKQSGTTLKDLVIAGYLSPGTITSLLTNYPGTAELTADGFIILDGNSYSSPSSAAIALAKRTNPSYTSANGWISWEVVVPSGETKVLSKVRDEYNQTMEIN